MTRVPLLAVALREPAARLMSAFLHLGIALLGFCFSNSAVTTTKCNPENCIIVDAPTVPDSFFYGINHGQGG